MENFQEELIKVLSKLKNFVPVGTPWWGFDVKAKPIGVQLYQGQVLARDMYPVHWNYIQSYRTIISDAEWHTYAESHGGFCPYFSSGDEVGTYRMPKIVDVHPRFCYFGDDVGKYIEAGIPNIKGHLRTFSEYNKANASFAEICVSGPFYWESTWDNDADKAYGTATNVSAGSSDTYRSVPFDASRCSSVYRNDIDTIQPSAINMIVGEYVTSGISEFDVVTSNEIIKGIDALQADVGKVIKEDRLEKYNIAYITEQWRDSDNANWYRKWSNGFIEQGGVTVSSVNYVVVNMNISFSTTNYSVVCQHMAGTTTDTAGVGDAILASDMTTTTFRVSKNAGRNIHWYACGY